MAKNRTIRGSRLLLLLTFASGDSLTAQVQEALRAAIRDGRLAPGISLPATRALAADLCVSRGVVVEAYAQLIAEGYLVARPGSGTRVAGGVQVEPPASRPVTPPPATRYDFRPGVPDLAGFPRAAWSAALRRVLLDAPPAALGYPPSEGAPALREALAAYLRRARGVAVDASGIILSSGFTQALVLISRLLAEQGATAVAVEDPCHPEVRSLVERAGLRVEPVAVDACGIRVDALDGLDVQAVLVTPAHQFPSGVVLSPERRADLVAWARRRDALLIEDDYDAEYRYDREPVGALQGLAPERVVYGGSVSKTLAPALRIGWLAPPHRLLAPLAEAKRAQDLGSPTLEQLAFADFINSGAFERHLRRARQGYRARRDALMRALAWATPPVTVRGIAAGLHLVAELSGSLDEGRVVQCAERRGLRVYPMAAYRLSAGRPALVLGYGGMTEHDLVAGAEHLVQAIAEASDGVFS